MPFIPGTPPTVGAPVELFTVPTPVTSSSAQDGQFDVFPDGQQFIAVAPRQFESGVSLSVTVNWTAGLRQ